MTKISELKTNSKRKSNDWKRIKTSEKDKQEKGN